MVRRVTPQWLAFRTIYFYILLIPPATHVMTKIKQIIFDNTEHREAILSLFIMAMLALAASYLKR